MTHRQDASVEDAFERALGEILVRVSASRGRIAVAYSGGLDSTALLRLAHAYTLTHRLELFAFHVHHGLSGNADDWLRHCERECAQLGIRFDARRVALEGKGGDGIEQAARAERYAALGELCRLHEVSVLLTAHHQDDQAETVLLQLLRGAGLAGLSGMASTNEVSTLLGGVSPVLARPLLDVTRAELERFVELHDIRYVEDESNEDTRYTRNALRHAVSPILNAHFPGYQRRLARAAEHAQSAQRLLSELAELDWQRCREGACIGMRRFRELSGDRQDNLLRHWFSMHRVRMPSTAWLSQMRAQLLSAREDAQVRVIHPDCEVRRHRDKAYLISRSTVAEEERAPQAFRWRGETSIRFPEFGGALYFEAAEQGIARDWLAEQSLEIRYRRGGEKLKLSQTRPTRSLKHHYQALDIPVWVRQQLPVVFAAGHLLFASGVGINWGGFPVTHGNSVKLRWEKDTV